jgi:protein-S-isoprenylcysteine O-methyltransferase Ste14
MKRVKSFWETAAAYLFAGLTALAGIVSLGVFGRFLSETRLGLIGLGMRPVAALVWDAVLCLIFFVQHSGMVRRSFRRWSERWMPGYLHGALYTFASAAALVLLCALWQPADPAPLILDGAVREVFRGLSLLAVLGFVWAFVSLDAFDAFGTGALLARFRRRDLAPPRLAVKGPYRWVRHPFYFLVIVLLWASPVVSKDRLLLNVLFTIWIVLGARWEERDLTATFGDDYRLHQREVPMLIPWRLPTKAEWETAAQAGTDGRKTGFKTPYPPSPIALE